MIDLIQGKMTGTIKDLLEGMYCRNAVFGRNCLFINVYVFLVRIIHDAIAIDVEAPNEKFTNGAGPDRITNQTGSPRKFKNRISDYPES